MLGLTAEQIGTVILGISMGLIAIMGGQKGKQVAQGRKETPSEMIEVAGAIVSDKAVDRMVEALDGFTASAKLLTMAIDRDVEAKSKLTAAVIADAEAKGKLTMALNRNSDVSEDMRAEIRDTATHLDKLTVEFIRNSARKD